MSTTRRTFLTAVAAGSATCCLTGMPGCATVSGQHAAGNIADLAEGGVLAVEGQPLVALRDATGVWAMTTICTHLSCDMLQQGTVTTDQLVCDCHESTFTPDGDVVSGPANAPLDNFEVTIDSEGVVTIDADSVVDPGTRTAV